MSSSYTKDLGLEVTLKLKPDEVFSISKVSTEWSNLIVLEFWVTKFIRDFGSSLPIGADYELEYIVLGNLQVYASNHYIISKGYINLLKAILGNRSMSTSILLYIAVKYNKLDIAKFLLEKGADVHISYDGPLKLACKNGNMEMVEFLLANGSDIHTSNDEALWLVLYDGNLELIKLLLDNGADINAQEDAALRLSAELGNIEIIEFLLANGADIHARNDAALMLAVSNNNIEIVKLLLAKGANTNANDGEIVISAATSNKSVILGLLIANGGDITARNNYALVLAAENNNLEIVKLLLDHGADINAIKRQKKTNKDLNKFLTSYAKSSKGITQCSAVTLKGTQCKKSAVNNGLCSIHSKK